MDYNILEFNLIQKKIELFKNQYELQKNEDGLYHLVWSYIFDLQEDEINDSITDNDYLWRYWNIKWHDSGIDAIIINDDANEIHLLNFKYKSQFKKSMNNFESNEIDKVQSFITKLYAQDESLLKEINPTLQDKCKEIWKIFEEWGNPKVTFYICWNTYNGFVIDQEEKILWFLQQYDIKFKEILIKDIIWYIESKNKIQVDWEVIISKKDFFEKTSSDIQALIVSLSATDIIKLLINSEQIRNNPTFADWDKLLDYELEEKWFEDNVRLFLKYRSNINKNIKSTVLDEDNNSRFFYYNNWITITCDDYEYSANSKPLLKIKNIQVVNGSQTIHSIFDAFKEDRSIILNSSIEILCRIYKTSNSKLKNIIAETTNSQNSVSSRDVRSNDQIQKIYQESMLPEYFYERKKNEYLEKPKDKRIDAEKAWQAIIAFWCKEPHIAKWFKKKIFWEKYNIIFNEKITADKLILAYKVYSEVEKRKNENKKLILKWENTAINKKYILYATYYILYILWEYNIKYNLDNNYEKIISYYNKSVDLLDKITKEEMKISDWYEHSTFFKNSTVITKIDNNI